ncbi:MAG: hypothetical protein ACYTDY_16365 [Planctomycetota bacterium]|jgi:hypothetical protein
MGSALRVTGLAGRLVIGLLLLGSCRVTDPAWERVQSFKKVEYAPYAGSGDCSISGRALMNTRGGDVKVGAGRTVYLTPVTAYSKRWLRDFALQGRRLPDTDPRVKRYSRETVADGEGRFEFRDLPPGRYYLLCRVFHEIPSGYYGPMQHTGAAVAHAEIHLRSGEQRTDFVLSQ